MLKAYIAIGSNQDNPIQNVRRAFTRLQELSAGEVRVSSLWRSTPIDCQPGSPEFINAAADILPLPGETPETLLRKLQAMEIEAGRKPKAVLNEPRPLDLDLISFGEERRNSPELILPHPRAHQRRFVLAPLAEIAPELRLLNEGKSLRELMADAPDDTALRRVQG